MRLNNAFNASKKRRRKRERVTHIYVSFFLFLYIFSLSKERGRQCKGNSVCNSFSRRLFRLPNTIVLILHCYRLGRVRRKYLTFLSLLFYVYLVIIASLILSLSSSFFFFFSYICTSHDDNELKNNNISKHRVLLGLIRIKRQVNLLKRPCRTKVK